MWLSKRDTSILNALIELYVIQKKPVSSKNLSVILPFSESLLRKELHKLESYGFIKKSSVSSGRTPSDRGLKLYLKNLDKENLTGGNQSLPQWGTEQNFYDLSNRSADILSSGTNNIGFIYFDSLFELPFKRIRLVKTGISRIMVVLNSSNGWVFSKILLTDKNYSDPELKKWETILNEEFLGKSLKNVFKIIRNRLFRYKEKYMNIYRGLYFLLGSKDLSTADLIYKGILNLIDSDMFDPKSLKKVVETLQRKERFAGFLKDILTQKESIPIVAFGKDSGIDELAEFMLVVSNFEVLASPLGKIGVIGPKFMKYSESISQVKSLSCYFSEILSGNQTEA